MLYAGDLPLYDGLTYFRIGTDDSLRNMRKRYNKFQKVDKLATTILLAVFENCRIMTVLLLLYGSCTEMIGLNGGWISLSHILLHDYTLHLLSRLQPSNV